tara:strand:+ start:104 stop:319 length:216 start_codon:yes stop_codon:yes gene_type:complete
MTKENPQNQIKLRSFEDCDNLIGKQVSYYYGSRRTENIRKGIVQSYEQEGRKVWFRISNVWTNMHKLIEIL